MVSKVPAKAAAIKNICIFLVVIPPEMHEMCCFPDRNEEIVTDL